MKKRVKRFSLPLTGFLALLLLSGACSDDDSARSVAGDGGGTETSAAPAAGQDPIAFSRCMRENGIKDFPDLDAQGNSVSSPDPEAKALSETPEFKAAEKKCMSLRPGGTLAPYTDEQRAADLEYSKCMREKGVPKYPDPDADGNTSFEPGDPDLDPSSTSFQQAEQACKKYRFVPEGANNS